MERSRKRTPIIQRSREACTIALVALGCTIFGVSGAAAGDSTYHRHLREHAREQRLARLALAHRTPKQFVLAMKPASHPMKPASHPMKRASHPMKPASHHHHRAASHHHHRASAPATRAPAASTPPAVSTPLAASTPPAASTPLAASTAPPAIAPAPTATTIQPVTATGTAPTPAVNTNAATWMGTIIAASVIPDTTIAAPVTPDTTTAAPVTPDTTTPAPVAPDTTTPAPVAPDTTTPAPVGPATTTTGTTTTDTTPTPGTTTTDTTTTPGTTTPGTTTTDPTTTPDTTTTDTDTTPGTDTTDTDTTNTDTTDTDTTNTDTTDTDTTDTDTTDTDTTPGTDTAPGHASQQASGTSNPGMVCHGRCSITLSGGVLPASLPSTTSQASSGAFNLTAAPIPAAAPIQAATPIPAATTIPASTETVPVDISTASLPISTPPAAPAPTTGLSTPSITTIPLINIPIFPTSRLLRVTHAKGSHRVSRVAPIGTAGSSAASAGIVSARRTAPAAGRIVAAAPAAAAAAGTATRASTRTRHAAKKPTPASSGLAGPISSGAQVIHDIVKVIPTAVWVALGGLAGLALAFAALALRSSRRARRQAKEFAAISAAAQTDALTGILNRRGFMDAAERELARASRYERPFVLAYVDVRGLKAVNDTEGHLIGDELIKAVAGLMKESARADDVVGRIGGDEFALLLAEQTAEGAEPVLRRIRARVNERRAAMEIRVPWELTIGIAAFPEDGATLEELLGVADRRLYEQRGIALR